jgi:hypothetical protein
VAQRRITLAVTVEEDKRLRRLAAERHTSLSAIVRAALMSPAAESSIGGLSRDDLIGILESLAQSGNLRAIELLLLRPWERGELPEPEEVPRSMIDELAERRRA